MGAQLGRVQVDKIVDRAGTQDLAAASAQHMGHRESHEDRCSMLLSPSAASSSSSTSTRPRQQQRPQRQRHIFGVFDGLCGESVAHHVARELPRELMALLHDNASSSSPSLSDADAGIEAAFVKVDESVAEMALADDLALQRQRAALRAQGADPNSRVAGLAEQYPGGATAAVAMIDVEQLATMRRLTLTTAHVGDSRVLVIRAGRVLFATADHKPSDPTESERITRAGGTVRMARVNGELAISRCFGCHMNYKSLEVPAGAGGSASAGRTLCPRTAKVICVPDISRVALQPGDIVLLATDGVFEANFTDEQVASFVAERLSSDDASRSHRPEAFQQEGAPPLDLACVAAAVCDQASRLGAKDNVTCMLLQIGVDGRDIARQFGAHTFLPGPAPNPSRGKEHARFEEMLRLGTGGQMSPGEALFERWRYQRSRVMLAPPRFSELVAQCAFSLMDHLDIVAEQQFFGDGPPERQERGGGAVTTREEQVRWFENLYASQTWM